MIRVSRCLRTGAVILFTAGMCVFGAVVFLAHPQRLCAQTEQHVWSSQEKPIAEQIKKLRELPDDVRARTTKQLAIEIRELPAAPNKLRLANSLANLSTE